MAEGWARYLRGDLIEPYSAGIEKHGLNPYAVRVMQDAGVDISGRYSTLVEELPRHDFDFVITVCDHAHESCPLFTGRNRNIHQGIVAPPRRATQPRTEEEILPCYRQVRDEIREYILPLPIS